MLNQESPSRRHLRDRDRHLLLCSRFVAMMGLVSLIPIVTFHNNITDHTYLSHDLPSKQPNSNDNFSLARTQSFGFFDDITNEHWRRLQDIVARHWNHLYPETPLARHPSLENNWRYPQWWQSNYEPNFSCQFEMRVGATGKLSRGNGDGPKWVCDPHRIKRLAEERKRNDPNHPGCVIYSVGSAGDFSFEKGLEEILGPGTCEYHIFDMGNFERQMQVANISRAHFHRWGLMKQGPENIKPGEKFYGMNDTIKLLGHENLEVIDIFKIDCESCEWRTYKDWLAPGIPSIQQIQVELHSGSFNLMSKDDSKEFDTAPEIPFFEFFEEAGYVWFHKEPNILNNDGSCEEYAFLKLDEEFFVPRKKVLKERNMPV